METLKGNKRGLISNRQICIYVITEVILFAAIKIAEWKAPYAITGKLMYSAILFNLVVVMYSLFLKSKNDGGMTFSIDNLGIPLALVLTLAADTFLVLIDDIYVVGYLFFCMVQTVYAFYLKMTWKNALFRVSAYGLFLLVLYMVDYINCETIIMAWSMTQLSINVVISWLSYAKNKNISRLFFAIGILLFFGCDASIGFRSGFSGSENYLAYNIFYYLVWTFYVPSQVMIALSYFSRQRESAGN